MCCLSDRNTREESRCIMQDIISIRREKNILLLFFDYRLLSILSSFREFFFFNFSLFVFIHGIIDLFQKIIYCFMLTIVGAVTKRKRQLIRFFS